MGAMKGAKQRMMHRTEAALNERLASAAATLQSYKMRTIAVAEQHAVPQLPPATLGRPKPAAHKGALDRGIHELAELGLRGDAVPSSNDRLNLILADMMH